MNYSPITPPEELDAQPPDKQGGDEFQLFTSLLCFRSGWFAIHSLAVSLALKYHWTCRVFQPGPQQRQVAEIP